MVVQLRGQRKRSTAVLANVAPSFVYLPAVPFQTRRDLELFITSITRIVVHVFVSRLVYVSNIFSFELDATGAACKGGTGQVPVSDVSLQIVAHFELLPTVRALFMIILHIRHVPLLVFLQR